MFAENCILSTFLAIRAIFHLNLVISYNNSTTASVASKIV